VRAAVLVLAIAAHNVLAKTIYAFPPPGVDPAQAAAAGWLMYYAAAPVELAMIIVLCREWARTGYAQARRTGRGLAGGASWHSDDGRSADRPIPERLPTGETACRS
jgi:putative membrane protein